MNKKDEFLLLSNSKYAGQPTIDYFSNKKKIDISKLKDEIDLTNIKKLMKMNSVDLIEPKLKNIENEPVYLYKRGLEIPDIRVSIVGSRDCSEYGKKIAYDISYNLSKLGVTIVSGMAYGIDYISHLGAIKAKGNTIAVLGSGILNIYPKQNEKIYYEIIKNGCVISEYGLNLSPKKYYFPFRNRLISALSDIVVVVEAKERSGTTITVNHALNQGKSIIAVPGRVDSKYSVGTNKLIQNGAKIYTKIEDILEELQLELMLKK